jgi:arsenate reductase
MAEALLNDLFGDRFEAFSAGISPTSVNPIALKVLNEIEIDTSLQRSKSIDMFSDQKFDWAITVCNNAKEQCPFIPGAKKYLHHSFIDPSEVLGSEFEILEAFRRVRDNIRDWIKMQFGEKKVK